MNNYIDCDNNNILAHNLKLHSNMLKKILKEESIDKDLNFYTNKLIDISDITSNYLININKSNNKFIANSLAFKKDDNITIYDRIIRIINLLKDDFSNIGLFGSVWSGDYASTTREVFDEILTYIYLNI